MQMAMVPLDALGVTLRVAFEANDVLGVEMRREMRPVDAPKWLQRAFLQLLEGKPGPSFRLEGVTPFQRTVLERTLTIPRGQVRTYGELAEEAGHPRAMRAVGSTMARNPLPLIIPCHRVVCSDGRIGAYSGTGVEIKRRLLKMEGALEGEDRWRRTKTS